MAAQQAIHYPWLDILDRPIAFHRIFVDLTGSINAALMLSQACYWARRTTDPEGWFYKTQEEWREETGLKRSEQETARAYLRTTGFWKEHRRGIPARLYFCVDLQVLGNQLANKNETFQHSCMRPPDILDGHASANLSGPLSPTITETTAETTQETPPPRVPPRGQRYSPGFEQFWHDYPCKEGIEAAWNVWKRKKLEPRAVEICASIPLHHSQDRAWHRGYIKAPARYLADGCWQDEFADHPRRTDPPTTRSEARTQRNVDNANLALELMGYQHDEHGHETVPRGLTANR